jgi:hypothetical protein
VAPGHYPLIVAVHAAWLVSLWVFGRDQRVNFVAFVGYLAIRIGDGRRDLHRVDHDLIAEDEPKAGGFVHQPFQRALRQRVARVTAADVRVRADEPSLLHLIDRPVRGTPPRATSRA